MRWLCPVCERQRISGAPALSCDCGCHTSPVLLGWGPGNRTPGHASPSMAGASRFSFPFCLQFLSRWPAQGLGSCSTVSSMSLKPWGPYWSLHPGCWPSVVLTAAPSLSSVSSLSQTAPSLTHGHQDCGHAGAAASAPEAGTSPSTDRKECTGHVQKSDMQGFLYHQPYLQNLTFTTQQSIYRGPHRSA